jgi:hypothetical protein
VLSGLCEGRGADADLGRLNSLLRSVTDANRCYLGTEEQTVVSSILRAFPDDVASRIEAPGVEVDTIHIPLIKNLGEDGTVVYDDRHRRKRPDWTFDD